MKKQIFLWGNDVYGPDVISFPEFCALNRWIYDTRGQIDMNPPLAAGIMKAFEEKKFFDMGPFGLRVDNGIPPVIDAMLTWILFHLHPLREVWDGRKDEMPKIGRVLTDAGFDITGWDGLL